jgi:hypothetical protein
MNHNSGEDTDTTITTTDTTYSIRDEKDPPPIGLIMQFLNAKGCPFAQASLARISRCTPHTTAPSFIPALSSSGKMPHLGYIGEPPPNRGSSSRSMSDAVVDDGDNEALAAAAEDYITGAGAGGEADPIDIINVDNEDHGANLPVLFSIWECPMINKFAGFDDNGKSYAGWTCGWLRLYYKDTTAGNVKCYELGGDCLSDEEEE